MTGLPTVVSATELSNSFPGMLLEICLATAHHRRTMDANAFAFFDTTEATGTSPRSGIPAHRRKDRCPRRGSGSGLSPVRGS